MATKRPKKRPAKATEATATATTASDGKEYRRARCHFSTEKAALKDVIRGEFGGGGAAHATDENGRTRLEAVGVAVKVVETRHTDEDYVFCVEPMSRAEAERAARPRRKED